MTETAPATHATETAAASVSGRRAGLFYLAPAADEADVEAEAALEAARRAR